MKIKQTMIAVAILIFSVNLLQADKDNNETMPALTWKEHAVKQGLSAEDIALLKKNRILISNKEYKQIFYPYLGGGKTPLFITSDSLLNAYHVLYEESIIHLEYVMAERLHDVLKLINKKLDSSDEDIKGKPELVAAAKKRAVLIIAVALKLMDDSFELKDSNLNKILKEEIKRIEKGEGVMKPDWLGKPDETFTALDYSRYKPRGFYTRTKLLKQYFRAISWLQSIPFRVQNDEELLSIILLSNTLYDFTYSDKPQAKEIKSLFRAYRLFIGSGDDWDLMTAADNIYCYSLDLNGNELQKKRKMLIAQAIREKKGALINDQIRFAPDTFGKPAEINFRIISAYRTPGAILFFRTTDIRHFKREYPSGLEIAAALGSDFARKNLKDPEKEKIIKVIDNCQKYFNGDSLYLQYLYALKALLDTPEADAPDFMKTQAWQTKSCNTVLAGWAQLRHTYCLQIKDSGVIACLARIPPGFVEPEPEFFARMRTLVDNSRELLNKAGVFESEIDSMVSIDKHNGLRSLYSAADLESLWKRLAGITGKLEFIAQKQLRGVTLNKTEIDFIKEYGAQIGGIMLYDSNLYFCPHDDAMRIADVYYNPMQKGYLHSGVGRPRKIYVLYPWQGKTVLCIGAVLPYYEFVNNSRLTDELWKKKLDSSNPPEILEWLSPILSNGGHSQKLKQLEQ